MDPRFAAFPKALAQRCTLLRLGRAGDIPALFAHPGGVHPAPLCVWLHGRGVNKELDSGRYLRWIRAGIAALALDLPGHGERSDESFENGSRSIELIERASAEIDEAIGSLRDATGPEDSPVRHAARLIDFSRIALGGMSAGGMAVLHRMCRAHDFAGCAVEGTTGDFRGASGLVRRFGEAEVARVNPLMHIGSWRAVPVLALHSDADEVLSAASMRGFMDALRARYSEIGVDPAWVELRTWANTGAPQEHNGFGRVASEAKTAQVEFLTRVLGVSRGVSEGVSGE